MILENKDCITYLKTLETDSVDLVLTDPPYAIGFDDGKGWDSQWKTEDEYLNWCKVWTEECARVLKPNRMMVIWGTLKTDTFLRHKLEILNKIPELHGQNEIIWSYNWGGRIKNNFARKHEYAWCYSKGKEFLFNADDVRVERTIKTNMNSSKKILKEFKDKFKLENDGKEPSREDVAKAKQTGEIKPTPAFAKGTIPTSIWDRKEDTDEDCWAGVWQKNNHTTAKDYCGWHPTTKNIYLLERIIRAYTNPKDTVLDIFMGSGSTAIACNNTNRKSIGCEVSKEYYKQSLERIEQINKQVEEKKKIEKKKIISSLDTHYKEKT